MTSLRVALIGETSDHKKKIVKSLAPGAVYVEPKHSFLPLRKDETQFSVLGSDVDFLKDEVSGKLTLKAALTESDVFLLQYDSSKQNALQILQKKITKLKKVFGDEVTKHLVLVGTRKDSQPSTIDEASFQAFLTENNLATTMPFFNYDLSNGEPKPVLKDLNAHVLGIRDALYEKATQAAQANFKALNTRGQGRAYDTLWSKRDSVKESMIALLDDYAKGNSSVRLFFSAHAFRDRNATQKVNQIVQDLTNGNTAKEAAALEGGTPQSREYGILEAYQELCKIEVNKGGALHLRMAYLKEKLLTAQEIPASWALETTNLNKLQAINESMTRYLSPRA